MAMNKLLLNTDIYSVSNIKNTCIAYKEYADIEINKTDSYIELIFDNCKYDLDITIKEFENYLINTENIK